MLYDLGQQFPVSKSLILDLAFRHHRHIIEVTRVANRYLLVFRPEDKQIPVRYSRHFYDVAMMAEGKIKDEALADRELLAQVVKHKESFYSSGWARYGLAKGGSLRLVPPENRRGALEQDHKKMAVMIFGDPPSFGWILDRLAKLENEINK